MLCCEACGCPSHNSRPCVGPDLTISRPQSPGRSGPPCRLVSCNVGGASGVPLPEGVRAWPRLLSPWSRDRRLGSRPAARRGAKPARRPSAGPSLLPLSEVGAAAMQAPARGWSGIESREGATRAGLTIAPSSLFLRAGERFAENIQQQSSGHKLACGRKLPLRIREGECDQIVCCYMGWNAAYR